MQEHVVLSDKKSKYLWIKISKSSLVYETIFINKQCPLKCTCSYDTMYIKYYIKQCVYTLYNVFTHDTVSNSLYIGYNVHISNKIYIHVIQCTYMCKFTCTA